MWSWSLNLQNFLFLPTQLVEATWSPISKTCFRKVFSSRSLFNLASLTLFSSFQNPLADKKVFINLTSLNKHILCPTFRMQDATKLRGCIPQNCFFASIDLSKAFHHIPFHPRFQKFLSFSHNGNLYFFQAMPFGINLGPRIFTKVITEVLKLLRLQTIHASVYIDDFLLWNMTATTLSHQTNTATTLLTNLGLSVNWEKSSLSPLQ